MLYGIKLAMTEQDIWIPKSALCGKNRFLFWVAGEARAKTTKEEEDHFNQWAPSVVVRIPVAEKCNVHGEYFGIFTDGRAENRSPQYFSPGVHYLITPDFEVGVRVGWGLNQDAAKSFVNAGFGLQL